MMPFLLYTSDELWTRYYYVQGMESHHDYLYITGNPPEPTQNAIVFAIASGLVLFALVALFDRLLSRRLKGLPLSTRRPSLTRLFTVVLLILFFFTTWETSLNLFVERNPFQLFIPDPITMWSVNPKFRQIQDRTGQHYPSAPISSTYIGYAGEAEKPPGTFRVICLGDSQVVACADLNNDTQFCYPKCLERALQKAFPTRKLDVVNGGVSGYTSFQGLCLMRKVIEKQKPDVLVLGYGYHDSNYYLSSDHMVLTDSPFLHFSRNILYRSQIFIIMRKLLLRGSSERYDRDLNRSLFRRVPPDRYFENCEEFLKMGRLHGFKVVVMLQPLIGSEREVHERTAPYRQAANAFAAKHRLPLVDCYSVFERVTGEKNKALFTDNIHLSSKGHLIVAKEIFKAMIDAAIPGKLETGAGR